MDETTQPYHVEHRGNMFLVIGPDGSVAEKWDTRTMAQVNADAYNRKLAASAPEEPTNNEAQPAVLTDKRKGRPPSGKNRPNVDHGQHNISLELVSLTPEQQEEYKTCLAEIHSDLSTIHHAFLRFSFNIKRIQEKRLYLCGKYTTFAEFFQREIGIGRHQAYHYIHAADILTNLLALGFPESELPTRERICRALGKLEPDQLGKVWKLVLKYKEESGDEPTSNDVQRAVGQLGAGGNSDDDEGEDEDDEEAQEVEQREQDTDRLVREWEAVAKKLKVGLDGSTLTKAVILRLAAVRTDIRLRSDALLATLKKATEQQGDQKQPTVPEGAPLDQDNHEQSKAARTIMKEKQQGEAL
jgi:hypothetical protein